MCKIYSMSQERVVHHIFCSGSIGVGKTTTLEYLKKRLVGMDSIYFVKEYIDYDPEGKQQLEQLEKEENEELKDRLKRIEEKLGL